MMPYPETLRKCGRRRGLTKGGHRCDRHHALSEKRRERTVQFLQAEIGLASGSGKPV